MAAGDNTLNWYATRVIDNRHYVLKYLEMEGMETSRIGDIPSLLFIRCSLSTINALRYGEFRGYIYVYRKAGSSEPESIPAHTMKTFKILAPFHDEPVIYLSVDDPDFFKGQIKRVKSGIFAGCIGVIKRIKGQRRLIVKLSHNSAVATPYIPQELLEDVTI